jgi:DNA-binding transcriptional MocR family regulator
VQETVRTRHALVVQWLKDNADIIECAVPEGGVVCFPRIRPAIDTAVFYKRLFEETGTVVGPGHWFERPDCSFRLGFGWSTVEELEQGMRNISATIRALM